MYQTPVVGIDLGTTYCRVGVFQNDKVQIIANTESNTKTPCCVAFTDTARLIGDSAKSQSVRNSQNTLANIKRLLGLEYFDKSVTEDLKLTPFTVLNHGGKPKVCVEYRGEDRKFQPEEISAMMLTKMKESAEIILGDIITDVVLTVPACFSDSQRQATKDAATIAGLNVTRILNEPTAAAIAYGFDKQFKVEGNVLIFDLGGGKLDVSLLCMKGGNIEVKSTSGNCHLGGEDFDTRMFNHFQSKFKQLHGKNISGDKRAVCRLRKACEEAKRTLSSSQQACIEIDSLISGVDFNTSITRALFEKLCDDLFQQIIKQVETVLSESGVNKVQVDEVVLVGGSSRIPKVQQLLHGFFDYKNLCKSINPEEAVACGATVYAASLSGCSSAWLQSIRLSDITSHSLSVKKTSGNWSTLIDKNTTIPAKYTKTFHIGQTGRSSSSLQITVYENERDDTTLGRLEIITSPQTSQIDVTFEVDADGILQVTAADDKKEMISVTAIKGRLSDVEISKMTLNCEYYRKEDEKEKNRITAKNALEGYANTMISAAKDGKNKGKLKTEDRDTVVEKCESVLSWLEGNQLAEVDEFEYKQEEIKEVCHPIIAKILQHLPEHFQLLNVDGQAYLSESEQSDIDLLLVGKTGNGKSATGNALLKRECFHSAPSTSSVTTITNFGYAEYKGKVLKVVDGPGVGDTRYGLKERVDLVINEVSKAMLINPRGYHAFLLVVKYGGRFTDEDKETIELLKQMFGRDFVRNHCILIMTCGDLFEKYSKRTGQSFKQWCDEQTGVFHDLLKECCGRVVLFDNETTDEVKQDAQVDQLLDTLRQLQMSGHRYTDSNFKKAALVRQKARVESQRSEIEEVIHKEISLITQLLNQEVAKVERTGSTCSSRFGELSSRCKNLIQRIRAGDRGTGVLGHLETKVLEVKQSVDRTLEVQTSILQERENTRREMYKLESNFRNQQAVLENQLEVESVARKQAEARSLQAQSMVQQEQQQRCQEVGDLSRKLSHAQQSMSRKVNQAAIERARAEQQQSDLERALNDVKDKNDKLSEEYEEVKKSETRNTIVGAVSTVVSIFNPVAGAVTGAVGSLWNYFSSK